MTDPGDFIPPADNEELYAKWGERVLGLVRKLLGPGHRQQDIEDVAADIMEKLVARNVIGMYEADHISDHTGKPVTWKAFLSHQVALYVRGKREQVTRRAQREPLWCDITLGDGTTRWAELFGDSVTEEYPSLSDAEEYQRMRDYLALHPAEPGPCSLLALFDELAERLRNGQPLSRAAVQRTFGWSAVSADKYMDALRAALREAVTAPLPPKFDLGVMVLSAAELTAAIDLLRASGGNRVYPAFALAGHRLAGAGKKWYIPFAKEEIRNFPDIRIAKRTHATGHADHVKRALIHRLERMVHEAGGPAPVPEPEEETQRDLLEAQLWHIPGLSVTQVDAILAAAEDIYL